MHTNTIIIFIVLIVMLTVYVGTLVDITRQRLPNGTLWLVFVLLMPGLGVAVWWLRKLFIAAKIGNFGEDHSRPVQRPRNAAKNAR